MTGPCCLGAVRAERAPSVPNQVGLAPHELAAALATTLVGALDPETVKREPPPRAARLLTEEQDGDGEGEGVRQGGRLWPCVCVCGCCIGLGTCWRRRTALAAA